MNISKRLNITALASISLLLLFGCQEQPDRQEMRQPGFEPRETQPEDTDTSASDLQEQPRDERKALSERKRMEHQQPSFSQLDTDQDGYISEEEAQASEALSHHFGMLDKNGDGKVDSMEFKNFEAMQMRSLDMGGKGGNEEYGQEHATHPTETGKGPELPAEQTSQDKRKELSAEERMEKGQPSFSQLDTDQDGYISEEEAQVFEPLALHFGMLDESEDGKVDPAEFADFKTMQMRGFGLGAHGGKEEYGKKYAIEPTDPGKGPELPAEQTSQH